MDRCALLLSTIAAALFLMLLTAGLGRAAGPVLEPSSNSYFQLRDDNTGLSWMAAREKAATLSYQGRRGRLAIVRSMAVHSFLRDNFQAPAEVWIGLRYWCRYRILQWVTGEEQSRSNFGAWHRHWYRSGQTACGIAGTASANIGFMPVYYTLRDEGFLWQATGPAKGFKYYFVEYPPEEG